MAQSLVNLVLMWVGALFGSVFVLLDLIRGVFKVGIRQYFHWEVWEKPACLDDPSHGTHGYLHLENLRIHYVASGPEDKPLMLFVHGFPEFWFSWRHQMKEFNKDYRCVAFDMRGYGESDKPKGMKHYVMKNLMSDIKQVIVALGYKSCTLVAHDWGGAIAWAFARNYAEYVDKLIIMNAPPSPIMKKLLKTDSDQRKKSWYIFLFQMPFVPEFFMRSENFAKMDGIFKDIKDDGGELKAYKYTFSQPGALTPPINYYRAALQLEPTKYDMNYTMPVLVVWGCQDTALGLSIPKAIEESNNRNITVKRIESAHHFVQNEDPQTVNKLMREWLAE